MCSNRRLDNKFNILEGLTRNWFFIGINVAMCGAQVLIVFVGGIPFNITVTDPNQTGPQWATAIVLGLLSIPLGMLIRMVPDSIVEKCIPSFMTRKSSKLPGVTVSDEERFNEFPEAFVEVREELALLKKLKGGRLNNLKFAVQHPRETIKKARSPSHSRPSSTREPRTPTREDSHGSFAPTPESRARSRSTRSRSNSALGAPTVMAGIIAGSVAAGWSPIERSGSRDHSHTPRASSNRARGDSELELGPVLTEEPKEMDEGAGPEVPKLVVPQPPQKSDEA